MSFTLKAKVQWTSLWPKLNKSANKSSLTSHHSTVEEEEEASVQERRRKKRRSKRSMYWVEFRDTIAISSDYPTLQKSGPFLKLSKMGDYYYCTLLHSGMQSIASRDGSQTLHITKHAANYMHSKNSLSRQVRMHVVADRPNLYKHTSRRFWGPKFKIKST